MATPFIPNNIGDATIRLQIDPVSLLNEISNKLKTFMLKLHRRLGKQIESRIRNEIRDEIYTDDTYQELINPGSELFGIIGVPDVEDRIIRLIEKFLKLITVASNTSGTVSRPTIKYLIQLSNSDVQALVSDADAIFFYAAIRRGELKALPWLRWMLLDGAGTIVKDYELSFNPSRSRTRSFIMVESRGGTTRIPGQHQGTIDNNFLVNAVNRVDVGAIAQQFVQLAASKVI